MHRYGGEDLGKEPHIVVLGSCKVGNFVVSIPTLQGLRSRFPGATIGFIGSRVTSEFETALSCVDWRLSWDESSTGAWLRLLQDLDALIQAYGPVRLAVNLDGFNPVTQVLTSVLEPVAVAGGSLDASKRKVLPWGEAPSQAFLADPDWDSPSFLERYSGVLGTNYIAELFAVLAGVADYCDPSLIELPEEAPDFSVPDVLIHCTTARAAKIWPFEHWKVVVDALNLAGVSVGLVGAPPRQQQQAYNSGVGEEWLLSSTALLDLRGRTSLIQLAGACRRTRAVVSVDAGPLHIAAAMGTPTLAVVGNDADGIGASPIRLWMPRSVNAERTMASHTCTFCAEARFRNDACLADQHACMLSVLPAQVIAWLEETLHLH